MKASVSTLHYEVLKSLGDCYAGLAQYDKARECYGEAAALQPDFAGHQVGLGVVSLLEGRSADAAEAFRNVLHADPRCAEAHWGLALVHWQKQEYPQAAQACLQCVQLQPDSRQAVLGLFLMCKQAGDLAPGMKFVNQRLEKHPGDTAMLLCLAEAQSAGGDAEASRQTLLGILALEPGHPEARCLLAQLPAPAMRSGDASK